MCVVTLAFGYPIPIAIIKTSCSQIKVTSEAQTFLNPNNIERLCLSVCVSSLITPESEPP